MWQRWSLLLDEWRTRFWPLPALGVLLAIALGVGLPRVDRRVGDELSPGIAEYLFSGGPEAARAVLSAVAGSLITAASLIFSLTVVTLQLAASQYSPRILRTFVRDRFVQLALTTLVATFTYTVTVLRTVRASLDERTAFVPQLSVTVAYLLGVASVGVLVLFLAHLARQIRVESILRDVHTETTATIRRMLDDPVDARRSAAVPPIPADGVATLCAGRSGFLTAVDESALLAAATEADAVVVVDRLPGDSLIAGTPIAVAWPLAGAPVLSAGAVGTLAGRVGDAVRTGYERTATQDVAFGLRQIVDVAIRALSPGINDPTTAVHALGHAAALLCVVVRRDLGPRLLRDDAGRVRVLLRRPDLGALLDTVVSQPRRYGAGEPLVLARLLMLLREVAWSTDRPEYRRAIDEQLTRLTSTLDRQDLDHAERDHLSDLVRGVHEALTGRWRPAPS